jgi:hypothetical protein
MGFKQKKDKSEKPKIVIKNYGRKRNHKEEFYRKKKKSDVILFTEAFHFKSWASR